MDEDEASNNPKQSIKELELETQCYILPIWLIVHAEPDDVPESDQELDQAHGQADIPIGLTLVESCTDIDNGSKATKNVDKAEAAHSSVDLDAATTGLRLSFLILHFFEILKFL